MSKNFLRGVAWVNGDFVDISDAKIPILDWGFLRSDATYDVVHVWKNRFFLLDEHVDRFNSRALLYWHNGATVPWGCRKSTGADTLVI